MTRARPTPAAVASRDAGLARLGLLLATLLAAAGLATGAAAAGKQKAPPAPDRIALTITGVDDAKRNAVRDALDLHAWRKRADLNAARLARLERRAPAQARAALEIYGYYNARVEVSSAQRADGWDVVVAIEPGEPVRVGKLDIAVTGAGAPQGKARIGDEDEPGVAAALRRFRPRVGEVFDHVVYEESKRGVERALLRYGYFDFEATEHRVEVSRKSGNADVRLRWDSGPRLTFGEVSFSGAQFPDAFMRRFVRFRPGDPFDQRKLDEMQQGLAGSEYFGQISVAPDPEGAVDGAVPVRVLLSPTKRTVYSAGLVLDSDYGGGVRFGLDRRWMNDRGHRLRSKVEIDQYLDVAAAEYVFPRGTDFDSAWAIGARWRDEYTDAVDAQSYSLSGSLLLPWRDWSLVASLNALEGTFIDSTEVSGGPDSRNESALVVYPELRADRVFARDRIRPRRGASLSLRARAASDSLLSEVSLAQIYGFGRYIRPLGKADRLLLRTELGATATDRITALPPELRFYAGGVNSVRGYEFQSVGQRDPNGDVIGGKYLVTASVEYEHQFRPAFAWAAFVDTGDAWSNGSPDLVFGVGFGIRWISPVGPVRVDLAHGLENDDHQVTLHVSAGPDL